MFSQCFECKKCQISAKCCYIFGLLNLFTCMNLCSNSSLLVISTYLIQLVLLERGVLAENKAEFFSIFLRIT